MKIDTCHTVVACIGNSVDQPMTAEEAQAVELHLLTCDLCRQKAERLRSVQELLHTTFASCQKISEFRPNRLKRGSAEQDVDLEQALSDAAQPAAAAWWSEQLQAAPWWAVSVALHLLAIALAALWTTSGTVTVEETTVTMVTEFKDKTEPKLEKEQPWLKEDLAQKLLSKMAIPPTDANSQELSDIFVPPDLLAQAELGERFETINPDREDTQSAFGTEDSHIFYSQTGNAEPAGGGMESGTLEDVIGVGGGRWGFNSGSGLGTGFGSGRGSFGNRNGGGRRAMVQRFGGTPATEDAVERALAWLARNQEPDGHWDFRKHEGSDRYSATEGDCAVTGFALLAFLGAGHTSDTGKYRENVRRAVYWLVEQLNQNEKTAGPGRFCPNNYTQGIAALALAEACAMMPRDAGLRSAAQKAIAGVTAGQIKVDDSVYFGWDYKPRGTTNDTSVTGWNIMALKAAKVANLQVDPFSLRGAIAWMDAGQNISAAPQGAEAAYWDGGMMVYRGTVSRPEGRRNMAMTAAAALSRLFVGGEKPDSPGVAGPCNLMLKPEHLPSQWPGNLYYWYYGTLVMFQKGGRHWTAWNEPLKKTLLEAQRRDGAFDGSWNPLDGEKLGFVRGGRVMSTSLGALSLEVYYRYALLR